MKDNEQITHGLSADEATDAFLRTLRELILAISDGDAEEVDIERVKEDHQGLILERTTITIRKEAFRSPQG